MTAASFKAAQYRVRVSRFGPSMVDPGPTVAALAYARAAGITWRDIGRATGMQWQQVERIGNQRKARMIAQATRDTILAGLGRLTAQRLEALGDCQSAVTFARRKEAKSPRWPTAPLRQALERLYGSLKAAPLSSNDERYLYRSEALDEMRAEKLCREVGLFPEAVWDDWYRMEEAG